jgi:RNA polymerase sigma factor (sigma-70 family)
MTPEEKQLLDAVFAREPGALEALLDRYRALIYSVFHGPSFRFPYDFLDDLYQSFVLALTQKDFHKLRAFEGRNSASLATFLQVVATRFALDERRKWHRHPRGRGQAGLGEDELILDIEDTEGASPDEPALNQEELDTFHNLLFSLDWKRISAVLWVFRSITRERIAEVMATSRANIDALYKRAKDQMTELYQSGAGLRRTRATDPEVITPEVRAALRRLLRYPTGALHEALLRPGARRRALLGMVLLNYPRFRCSRQELARIADSVDLEGTCLGILEEVRARLSEDPA